MRSQLLSLAAAAGLAALLPLQASAQAPGPQSAFCQGLVQSFDTEFSVVERHVSADDPHLVMAKRLRDRAQSMCASDATTGLMEIQRANRMLADVAVPRG